MLETLFRSRVLVKLLNYFMRYPDKRVYLREISRIVGEPASAVRRELDRLTEIGLLQAEMHGNHKYFQIKEGLPILPELKGLFLKTEGAVDYLRESLNALEGVRLAFVYGGLAERRGALVPEINVAIIGLPNIDELDRVIKGMQIKLGRKINCSCYRPDEFRRLLEAKDPSLNEALSGEKLVLVANIAEKN